jgi:hypothetical protein
VRIFVLGAGASFHAGYPLARNLGAALVEWAAKNPRPDRFYWIDADELHWLFHSLDDFEQVISELQSPTSGSQVDKLPKEKRGSILASIREVLCEYFDILRLTHAPLYWKFAEHVISQGDTIITFNYDVSLEAELRKADKWHISDGYGFSLADGITPVSPVKILKLHGSTSWIDILFDGAPGGSYGAVGPAGPLGARPLILPDYFQFFGYPPELSDPQFKGGGSSRSGSMILPGRSKSFEARPRFWDHLWTQALYALRKASEIVVIGYSLPFADKRARDLLLRAANKNASISICCGGDNARIAKEFGNAGFASVEAHWTYFDDWITTRLDVRNGTGSSRAAGKKFEHLADHPHSANPAK